MGLWHLRWTQDASPGAWGHAIAESFPCIGPEALGWSPATARALLRVAPDVLHTHGLFHYTSYLTRTHSARTRRPYVVSPHGMLDPWALANAKWKKKLAGWLFEDRHLARATCIHSLCDGETRSIREFGLRQSVVQIANGIDIPEEKCKGQPPWRGKLEEGRKVLLFLGRIHPKKGIESLIKAWALMPTTATREWALAVVGWDQGGHEAQLRKLSLQLGVDDSVLFLGPQFGTDKAACYANAKAFVLPSFGEGLPMVVLEAWANGLPVLMTPECNLPEGFARGAAWQVDHDARSLAGVIQDLVGLSDVERTAMGGRGLDLVRDRFTWARIVDQMSEVYSWLLGGGSPPASVVR